MAKDIAVAANAATEAGDWPEALRLWRVLRNDDPDAFWPQYWEANMIAALGDRSAGRRQLEDLLKSADPRDEFTLCSRLTELALEDKDVTAALPMFNRVRTMPQSTPESLERLASWIIRLKLESPDFPPSIFDIDKTLLELMPA